MLALLQQYSLAELLGFSVVLALAIRSLISFYDWTQQQLERIFNKKNCKIELENRLKHGSQKMANLEEDQRETDEVLNNLINKINILVDSDKDAIKAYITKEHHHFCYQLGWIDDFNLDCLERRYNHYKDEGGNSFIEGFMDQLRNLPKQPPQ